MRRPHSFSHLTLVHLMTLAVATAAAGATIELTDARVEKAGPLAFRLTLAAKGHGIAVGSYGLRTYARSSRQLPGFVARNGYRYFAPVDPQADGSHMLLDGGPADESPKLGVFSTTVATKGWPDGELLLLTYADNRPATGAYVSARNLVHVVIADRQLERVWTKPLWSSLKGFRVAPAEVDPGESFRVAAARDDLDPRVFELVLRCPYTVGREELPPGFQYDPEQKRCWLNDRQDDGSFVVSTKGWKPGVYHLTLLAGPGVAGAPAQMAEYRDFAVKVRGQSQFDVAVASRSLLGRGTHFSSFCRLDDGSVLAHGKVSRDGGRTWQPSPHIPMAHQLRSGTILGLAMRTDPVPDRPGYFAGTRFISTDGGKTVSKDETVAHVPEATGGIGHAPYPGPIFWHSIVEQPDGSLLAAMYGWFRSDTSPVPGQPGSYRYRTFVVASRDQGKTWSYVSTVAYDPQIGTEGYCEPVIRRVPGGDLLVLLRTGGNNRPYWQDNPLCQTRSTDGGRTWAEPHRTGVEGVDPDLCVMADGTLACSYGRPGADLMLSTDRGQTWTDHTCIHPERYSGYTAVCEVEPGVLLYGYGVANCLDESTGRRSHQLWVARVRVQRASPGGGE